MRGIGLTECLLLALNRGEGAGAHKAIDGLHVHATNLSKADRHEKAARAEFAPNGEDQQPDCNWGGKKVAWLIQRMIVNACKTGPIPFEVSQWPGAN